LATIFDFAAVVATPGFLSTLFWAFISMVALTMLCDWVNERRYGSFTTLACAVAVAFALNVLYHHGWNALFYDGIPRGGRLPWEMPRPEQYKTLAKTAIFSSVVGIFAGAIFRRFQARW
jgi:hypothetical protein